MEPGSSATCRQGQTQEETLRIAAHRCHVARRPHQAFPSNGLGWMPISPKVGALEKPIRRQNGVKALLRPPNGRVVSDVHLNARFPCRSAARSRRARNFTQNGLFVNRPFASHFRSFLAVCPRSTPCFASQVYAASTCPFVQWTGIHSLSQIGPIRGLTQYSSELNMDTVASRDSRFRLRVLHGHPAAVVRPG